RPENGARYLTAEEQQTPPVPGPACITPCSAQVARSEDLVVTFSKPGYQPQTVELKREISGGGAVATAGNIIAGGVIGVGVDAVTGAAMNHTPNPMKVVLRPVPAAVPAAPKNEKPKQRKRDQTSMN